MGEVTIPKTMTCPSCSAAGVDSFGETCLQCGGQGKVDLKGWYLPDDEPDVPAPSQRDARAGGLVAAVSEYLAALEAGEPTQTLLAALEDAHQREVALLRSPVVDREGSVAGCADAHSALPPTDGQRVCDLELCPECMGSGVRTADQTCERCGGAGGVPAATSAVDAWREAAVAGLRLHAAEVAVREEVEQALRLALPVLRDVAAMKVAINVPAPGDVPELSLRSFYVSDRLMLAADAAAQAAAAALQIADPASMDGEERTDG